MDSEFLLRTVVPVVVVVAVVLLLEHSLERGIKKFGVRRRLTRGDVQLIRLSVRWVSYVALVVVAAAIFGVGVDNLWATLTGIIAMVLIGFFAVWSLLSNLTAALVILIWRPYVIGDELTIIPEGLVGEFREITLFHSRLMTKDRKQIQIPNNVLLSKAVIVSERPSSAGSSRSAPDQPQETA